VIRNILIVLLPKFKNQAPSCELGDLKDQLIRDRIVVGIKNEAVKERMLRENDLDLEKAINITKTAEVTRLHLQQLHETSKVSEEIKSAAKKKTPAKDVYQKLSCLQYAEKHKCRRCDNIHERGKCPEYGLECYKCKGINHFAKCCLSKNKD